MENLIERLRELDVKGYQPLTGAIGDEAATEIERLRALKATNAEPVGLTFVKDGLCIATLLTHLPAGTELYAAPPEAQLKIAELEGSYKDSVLEKISLDAKITELEAQVVKMREELRYINEVSCGDCELMDVQDDTEAMAFINEHISEFLDKLAALQQEGKINEKT